MMWTTGKVIDLLGGNRKTAELTGRSYNSVTNWRALPSLPSSLFLLMSRMLLERGIVAPPRLWGMEEALPGKVRDPRPPGGKRKAKGLTVIETREVA